MNAAVVVVESDGATVDIEVTQTPAVVHMTTDPAVTVVELGNVAGPAGPPGPPGMDGALGPAGPAGPAGPPGLSVPPLEFSIGVPGFWYVNPLAGSCFNNVATAGYFFCNIPWNSGPTDITIDKLDTYVNSPAAAGGVTRAGLYVVRDQANPWHVVLGAPYADLLVDAGNIDGTIGGQAVWTLAAPVVIPANTWFTVASANLGSACARYHWGGIAGKASPWGLANTGYSAMSGPNHAMYGNVVNDPAVPLPDSFVPGTLYGSYDSGIGVHRALEPGATQQPSIPGFVPLPEPPQPKSE